MKSCKLNDQVTTTKFSFIGFEHQFFQRKLFQPEYGCFWKAHNNNNLSHYSHNKVTKLLCGRVKERPP